MNHKQLTAFRMVMQHGSITEAARALSVSQPAVSRLIGDLELSIGFPLLLRTGGHSPHPKLISFFRKLNGCSTVWIGCRRVPVKSAR